MKRFTFISDGYYAVGSDVCFDDQDENYCGPAITKLAEYENTGLDPLMVGECLEELHFTRSFIAEHGLLYALTNAWVNRRI